MIYSLHNLARHSLQIDYYSSSRIRCSTSISWNISTSTEKSGNMARYMCGNVLWGCCPRRCHEVRMQDYQPYRFEPLESHNSDFNGSASFAIRKSWSKHELKSPLKLWSTPIGVNHESWLKKSMISEICDKLLLKLKLKLLISLRFHYLVRGWGSSCAVLFMLQINGVWVVHYKVGPSYWCSTSNNRGGLDEGIWNV